MKRAWMLGLLLLAGCGLGAAGIASLIGGIASVIGVGATAYVDALPTPTATPTSVPTPK